MQINPGGRLDIRDVVGRDGYLPTTFDGNW